MNVSDVLRRSIAFVLLYFAGLYYVLGITFMLCTMYYGQNSLHDDYRSHPLPLDELRIDDEANTSEGTFLQTEVILGGIEAFLLALASSNIIFSWRPRLVTTGLLFLLWMGGLGYLYYGFTWRVTDALQKGCYAGIEYSKDHPALTSGAFFRRPDYDQKVIHVMVEAARETDPADMRILQLSDSFSPDAVPGADGSITYLYNLDNFNFNIRFILDAFGKIIAVHFNEGLIFPHNGRLMDAAMRGVRFKIQTTAFLSDRPLASGSLFSFLPLGMATAFVVGLIIYFCSDLVLRFRGLSQKAPPQSVGLERGLPRNSLLMSQNVPRGGLR